MLFRVHLSSTSRTFDVCPTAVAKLFESYSAILHGGHNVLLHNVSRVEQVPLGRGARSVCDFHGGGLGSCP